MDGRARLGLAAIGVALYALASYELTTRAPDSAFTLAVVLGPMALAIVTSIWGMGQRGLAALLAVAALAAAALSTQGRGVPPQWLYFAQHAGMHAALGIWFAASLSPRSEPMITQLASRVHALSPAMRDYTRKSTVGWVVYFVAMTAMSALLFAAAPFATWSLFANLLTPISLALMFVGDHLVRYWLHPEFERIGLLAAARAFSAAPPTPGSHR